MPVRVLSSSLFEPEREIVLAITYAVVVISIVAQGLTIGPLLRRSLAAALEAPSAGERPA